MPDAFGNETPQEILARLQQQKAVTQRTFANRGGVGALRSNVQDIFSNINTSLDLRQQRTTDEALAAARVNAQEKINALPEDATELDRQIAVLETQLAEVGPLNTNVATGLTDQLLKATVQREELAALRGRDRRADAAEAREVDEFAADTRGRNVRFIVDTESGTPLGTVDVTDADSLSRFNEINQGNPNVALQSEEDFVDARDEDRRLRARLKEIEARGKASGGISRAIERRRFTADAQAFNDFAATADQFVDLLADSRGQFGLGGQAVSGLQRVGSHARSFVEALDPGAVDINNQRIDSRLELAGVADAQRRALVIDLAYAIATSREGGRLTDQDVDRAIQTVGGQEPDVRNIVSVFGGLVDRRADTFNDRLILAGLQDDENSIEAHNLVKGRFEGLQKKLGDLRQGFEDVDRAAAAVDPTQIAPVPVINITRISD